jgi:hypothetical protein
LIELSQSRSSRNDVLCEDVAEHAVDDRPRVLTRSVCATICARTTRSAPVCWLGSTVIADRLHVASCAACWASPLPFDLLDGKVALYEA